MKKKTKIILIVVLVILIISGVGTLVAYNNKPEPPVVLMEEARKALSQAREKHADIYAPELYQEAQQLYDSAMILWSLENNRFFLRRDYSKVAFLAISAAELSRKSSEEAENNFSSVKFQINTRLEKIRQLLDELNSLSRFPLPESITRKASGGKMLMTEAQVLYEKGMYLQSVQKLSESENLISLAHQRAFHLISNYFLSFDTWQTWKEETIEFSRKNKTIAILVDKYAGKCFVYKNGKIIHQFDAELGKNWLGDKGRKGDQVTPEGLYHITDKKQGVRTKYYKALLINYPNEDDKRRFDEALKNGYIPANSKIGGLIEIHGHGGKGTDWTDGCVALTNKDMDIIFSLVEIGTPVTIIGSSIPLSEIISKKH